MPAAKPSHNSHSAAELVEQASRRRCVYLIVCAIAFLLWQLPKLEVVASVAVVQILSTVGLVIWTASFLLLLRHFASLGSRIPTGAFRALEDDLVVQNRNRSFVVGYIAAVVAVAATLLVSPVVVMSGADVATVLLSVCVAAPMYAFAYYESIHA